MLETIIMPQVLGSNVDQRLSINIMHINKAEIVAVKNVDAHSMIPAQPVIPNKSKSPLRRDEAHKRSTER